MFEYMRHCNAPKFMTNIQSDFHMAVCITQRPLKKKNMVTIAKKFKFTDKLSAVLSGMSLKSFKKMQRDSPLSELANEMVIRLAELFEIGLMTFDNDRASFIKWLDTHVTALNDFKPNQLIGSITGIKIVRDLLLRMEYSVF